MHFDVFQLEERSDHLYVAAKFWDTVSDAAADKPPRVINDFRIHAATEHQRIRRGPRGGLLHRSGAEVQPTERPEFLRAEGIRWARDGVRIATTRDGAWRRSRGKAVAPFVHRGRPHDPQWLRETFHISREMQAWETLFRYGQMASARGWEGDRRGTTLSLQVGAGADDGSYGAGGTGYDNAGDLITGLDALGDDWQSWYRFEGAESVPGATINAAEIQLWGAAPDSGTAETRLYACAAGAPAAPVSHADAAGRALTSAFCQWDSPTLSTSAFVSSADCSNVIQELADAGGYTTSVIQIMHHYSNPLVGYITADSYDTDSSHAPKLIIDLTAAAAPSLLYRRSRRPLFQR